MAKPSTLLLPLLVLLSIATMILRALLMGIGILELVVVGLETEMDGVLVGKEWESSDKRLASPLLPSKQKEEREVFAAVLFPEDSPEVA